MPCLKLGKITDYLPAIAPFICLAGIVFLQSQEYKKSIQELNRADYLEQEQEQVRKIAWQQQTPTLNFDNLIASWSYLNFVQYFGDQPARETIGYELVPDYFATISKLDPHFTQAHLRLAIANSMYAGNPEKSIALIEELLQSVDPKSEESALLWTSKGLDELLFLGDKEAAINSYKMAAKWASLSNHNNLENLYLKNLETALASTTEIELKEAQISAWSSILVNIQDYHRKKEIQDKISNLQAEISSLKEINSSLK
jgi:hypothetical protein